MPALLYVQLIKPPADLSSSTIRAEPIRSTIGQKFAVGDPKLDCPSNAGIEAGQFLGAPSPKA